jgi:hypothetical protein
MLYLSLVLASLLLVIANLSARRPGRWPVGLIFGGLGLSFAPVCLGFFSPPVALLFLFLLVAWLVWAAARRRRWLFLPLSGAAAAAAFGIAGWSALEGQQEYDDLREQFPFESMQARVPEPRPTLRGQLPEPAAQRLTRLEESLPNGRSSFRVYLLQKLHEEKVQLFINSPGFGVSRLPLPTSRRLTPVLRKETRVPQPDPRSDFLWSPGETTWKPRPWDDDLYRVHRDGVLDFANADGFGFVKDRRHVAGFESHRFSRVPGPAEKWTVQTLDLVGLLTHEAPVAYVSAHLPRMDELREAPTRPLDGFETSGLEGLLRGEDLVLGATSEGLRMLGVIRSVRQCVQCHGGERGDLLGAFSYTLRPRGR